MIDTIQSAVPLAIIVVAAVEAVRRRVPFDGWRVLVVAAGVSLAVATLFLKAYDVAALVEQGRLAAIAWLIAVGGDAWVAKLATKSKTVSIVGDPVFPPSEAPTKKEGRP